MKKGSNNFVKFSYGFNIFLAGVIVGYFLFGWNLFKIKYEIDLVALLGIVVTIILAIYITEKIAKKNTENRIEKDLVISRIVVLETDYYQLFSNFNSFKNNVVETTAMTDSIAAKVLSIKKLANTCEFSTITNFQNLIVLEKKFRDLLTDTNANNDVFVYTDAQSIKIEDTYTSITEVLTELIIELNRI